MSFLKTIGEIRPLIGYYPIASASIHPTNSAGFITGVTVDLGSKVYNGGVRIKWQNDEGSDAAPAFAITMTDGSTTIEILPPLNAVATGLTELFVPFIVDVPMDQVRVAAPTTGSSPAGTIDVEFFGLGIGA